MNTHQLAVAVSQNLELDDENYSIKLIEQVIDLHQQQYPGSWLDLSGTQTMIERLILKAISQDEVYPSRIVAL